MLYHKLRQAGYNTKDIAKYFFVFGCFSIVFGIISQRISTGIFKFDWIPEETEKLTVFAFMAGFFISIGILLLTGYLVFHYLEKKSDLKRDPE